MEAEVSREVLVQKIFLCSPKVVSRHGHLPVALTSVLVLVKDLDDSHFPLGEFTLSSNQQIKA